MSIRRVAFAESEDGRDLTILSAAAKKRVNEYSLQGKKRFVLNAPLVNAFLTLCKEPEEGWITLIVKRGLQHKCRLAVSFSSSMKIS